MQHAASLCRKADIFAVIGTSLQVYPAAGLIQYVPHETLKYVIDVKIPYIGNGNVRKIEKPASIGVPIMEEELLTDI
jgi:NAD-dependent deacetylase